MKIFNLFYAFLMFFSNINCAKNNQFIAEFSEVPLFVMEELICMFPFVDQSFVSFEKELAECRCYCNSVEIKELQNFIKKYGKYQKLCLRLKYEVLKIQFCKEEYKEVDRELFKEVSDFYGNDFVWYKINLLRMISIVEFELLKTSHYVSSKEINEYREFVEFLYKLDEQCGKNAEFILNKKERELFYSSVFNSSANVFFVNRFVRDCSNITANDCKYLDFYYYSIIKFLIDQEDADLNQDIDELFGQMKSRCACSEFIPIINSMIFKVNKKNKEL